MILRWLAVLMALLPLAAGWAAWRGWRRRENASAREAVA